MPETTQTGTQAVQDEAQEQTQTSEASGSSNEIDRPALESKVSAGLAALSGDNDPQAPEPEVDEPGETSTTDEGQESDKTGETTPADETSTSEASDEAAAEGGEGDGQKPDPKPAADPASTLPAAYRRSLKAAEWTDEEIDSAFKTQGNKFLEYAQKVHTTRNAEVNRWAELGRQAKQQQPTTPAASQKPADPLAGLKPVDVAAVKAKYGDDGLIDEIVTPLNNAVALIQQMLPAVQAVQQRSTQAELETIGRQVAGFFASGELKPYAELYGGESARTPEQESARVKLLETADALMGGAKMQGRQLSVDEALTFAHDSLSGGYKQQVARKQIVADMKKRSKGITLTPSSGKKSGSIASGKPAGNDRDALVKRTQARLSAAFSK